MQNKVIHFNLFPITYMIMVDNLYSKRIEYNASTFKIVAFLKYRYVIPKSSSVYYKHN